MSARKKWRLKVYPSFTYQPAPSMKAAYALSETLRHQYAQNLTPVHRVNIEVDEGCGWELFEICEFPEREVAGDE